jgi:hypothetical protein
MTLQSLRWQSIHSKLTNISRSDKTFGTIAIIAIHPLLLEACTRCMRANEMSYFLVPTYVPVCGYVQ